MTKVLKLLAFFIFLILILTSCKKVDLTFKPNENTSFQQAKAFLELRKTTVTTHQAKKIERLLQNLLYKSARTIKVGETDLILCDLKTYKNVTKPEYTHTYYKASFLIESGKILNGFIYTIHTNLPKEKVNEDIQNILLLKSHDFTGEIVTNALNDQFLSSHSMKNGLLDNTKELSTKSRQVNSQVNARTVSSDCVDWYLVTTTYYPDGHTETDWRFLYRLCGPCNTGGQPVDHFEPDCDPNTGGGGDGGGDENTDDTVVSNINIEEYQTDQGDDNSSGTNAPARYYARIKYSYHAQKRYVRQTGDVSTVTINNITADPMSSAFVDSYNRNGTRTLTLLNHFNTFTRLIPPMVMVNWSCAVHGRYITTESDVWTRQWTVAKTLSF